MERHRILWLWLRAETPFFEDRLTLLHFAPEWGLKHYLATLANLDYHTADLESPLADEHFDIGNIPYADNSVDVIFCNHVLEHIPEDRRAMSELYRILRPGGWAVVMTPLSKSAASTQEGLEDPGARLRAYGQEDHVRLYGRDFYERLSTAGFDAERIDYVDALPDDLVQRYQLRREHPIFEDDVIIVARKADDRSATSG